ncbi:MAG: hypothetical protein KAY24_10360 [Candidatus Eisenbacteria sp.]|nr:hypothetical protein [Candidatus Eisenbacteria bacterium]
MRAVCRRCLVKGIAHMLGAVAFSLCCCFATGSARAEGPSPRSAGLWVDAGSWEVSGGDISQSVTGLWMNVAVGPDLEARIEASGSRAENDAASRGFGQGLTGALLVRYQPRGEDWLLQLGAGLPSGGTGLNSSELALIQQIGEPVLGFPDADPVRGWRYHMGGLYGVALSHCMSCYAGAGYEFAASFEPVGDIQLEPGNRLSGLLGLEAEQQGRVRGGLQFMASAEGAEKADGRITRDSRRFLSARLSGQAHLDPLLLDMACQLASTGATQLAALDAYDSFVDAGPGRLGQIAISIASVRSFSLGGQWRIQPSVTCDHRSFTSEGLAYGEGWAASLTPELRLTANEREAVLSVGKCWGKWRPWLGEELGPREEIDGLRVTLELLWRLTEAAANTAADDTGQ